MLTDSAVVSSLVVVDLWPLGVGFGLFFLALDVVCFGGTWTLRGPLLFDLATLTWPSRLLLFPWTPWESGLFKLYTGIETKGMPETALQTTCRKLLSNGNLRWRAAAIGSTAAVVPWLIVLWSHAVDWRGEPRISVVMNQWPSLIILGLVTGSAMNSLAVSFMVRAVRRAVTAEIAPIPAFGSIGFSVKMHGVSRYKVIVWFIIGLVAVSILGYCRGLANRSEREQHFTQQPQ
jgi:hypothetical protein